MAVSKEQHKKRCTASRRNQQQPHYPTRTYVCTPLIIYSMLVARWNSLSTRPPGRPQRWSIQTNAVYYVTVLNLVTGDPLTFPAAPLWHWHLCFCGKCQDNYWVDCNEIWCERTSCAQDDSSLRWWYPNFHRRQAFLCSSAKSNGSLLRKNKSCK